MSLYAFDREYRVKTPLLCGVDEAGRGPLAGPVCAAAVILPEGVELEGLNDSKKLTEKRRERLFDDIRRLALGYGIALVGPREIDEHNILQATMLAMGQAVEQLPERPGLVLVDGNRTPELGVEAVSVVKGDGLSASIAAASILAKVTRDRLMAQMEEEYPGYGFAKHKGYPTKAHYEALDALGPCAIHRQTFLLKWREAQRV